ncbi:TraI domain-containing protein [Photobacterium damselae subsp. damselae]|uniref:TraI domain-containing protein n=1 Tax=Photobacterium damselae subsp. damselae TaxID=85581 RepID=A0A850QWB0_PHODD|nr:TraI domain-containing protein [Photobacterium damselae subsp. damselae]
MKLLSIITNLFGGSKKNDSPYVINHLNDDVIGYPPSPRGLPIVANETLLANLNKDIQRIRSEIGVNDADFEKYIYPAFRNLICFVHLVPASEYHHHSTGGGLVYHSLDVAKRCMRRSFNVQFPSINGTTADANLANSRWRIACVLAGLYHDVGKVVSDMEITDKTGVIKWDYYKGQTIFEWALENNIDRYFIKWVSNRHGNHKITSTAFLQKLIPAEFFSWIDEHIDGKAINNQLLNGIMAEKENQIISSIVIKADADSVRQDHITKRTHLSNEAIRVPLYELIFDTIKYLTLGGHFKINTKGYEIWNLDSGFYISWNAALESNIYKELDLLGIEYPKDPDVLAGILHEHGYIQSNNNDKGNDFYFKIKPEIFGKKNIELKVVKLSQPAMLNINFDSLPKLKDLLFEQQQSQENDNKKIAGVGEAISNDKAIQPKHDSINEQKEHTDKVIEKKDSNIETIVKPISIPTTDKIVVDAKTVDVEQAKSIELHHDTVLLQETESLPEEDVSLSVPEFALDSISRLVRLYGKPAQIMEIETSTNPKVQATTTNINNEQIKEDEPQLEVKNEPLIEEIHFSREMIEAAMNEYCSRNLEINKSGIFELESSDIQNIIDSNIGIEYEHLFNFINANRFYQFI